MNLKKVIFILTLTTILSSCADFKTSKINQGEEKKYFSSIGFALIFEEHLYKQKVVSKKIKDDDIKIMHNFLKVNTPVKIINPDNDKFVKAKINKKANYPKIFSIVISKKIASNLELDPNNPYVEILEIKKNKTFIAKEGKIFDEEKNVAEKAPVDEVEMNDLTEVEQETIKKSKKVGNFIIIISDFYFIDSANDLKTILVKKTKMNNISVKKINNKKYRLLAGPFENFNALKTSYISLNNLGFEDLNIYKD